MPVEHDVEQRSPEWFHLRAGRATSSNFGKIVTPGTMKMGGKGSETYAVQVAAERVVGGPLSMDTSMDGFRGFGTYKEERARAWYELRRGVDARVVGFIESTDGRTGCSPDLVVDGDPEGQGGVELKNLSTPVHVKALLGIEDPATWTQVQGSLLVTGWAWWDVLAWTDEPALGPYLFRHYPVDVYQRALAKGLGGFFAEVDKAEAALRLLGRDGRSESTELRLQLLKSLLVFGEDAPEDQLELEEVRGFAADLWAAQSRRYMEPEDFASFVGALKGKGADELRDAWASLQGALKEWTG